MAVMRKSYLIRSDVSEDHIIDTLLLYIHQTSAMLKTSYRKVYTPGYHQKLLEKETKKPM